MRALEFIRDHVTFKLPYDFSYHMKTPMYILCSLILKSKDLWIYGQNTQIAKYIVGGLKNSYSFTDTQYFFLFFYEIIYTWAKSC